MDIIVTEVGQRHFLFRPEETEGARCAFLDQGPLCLAVFVSNPTRKELHPSEIHLGLLVHERSVFLILKLENPTRTPGYFDMPYIATPGLELPVLPAGVGLSCSLAVCDDKGICRSLTHKNLTNELSFAFLQAVKAQIDSGFTMQEHERSVQSAYRLYPDSKVMFDATTIRDKGMTL